MDTEHAWAAGFFDGEGCVSAVRGVPVISICQNDPEVLERFKNATGVGRVWGPYAVGKPKHNRWEYRVEDLFEIQKVIEYLWPYLSTPKKNQARKHLYIVEIEGEPNGSDSLSPRDTARV